MPLFSGSRANLAPMDLENEHEPNDDYESYAMRQRISASWRPIDDDYTSDNEGPNRL